MALSLFSYISYFDYQLFLKPKYDEKEKYCNYHWSICCHYDYS